MMEGMTFLDFFAGIGTIRIGFERAGWTCNGHVEWDKFAQASYNAMHDIKDGEFCGWDIREVRADELPQSDLWTFGAPCQDFSIAGKRKGMDGERSSLVNEIFRLIKETPKENKPTWLLYENVKGMLSSNGGWDFLGILLEMDRLGYDVEWQVLNSKHFGVPQNRERVFTLGHFRGRGGRKVFPIGSDYGATDELQGQYGEQLSQKINQIGNLIDTDSFGGNPQTGRVYGTDGISPCLTAKGGGGGEPKIAIPVSSPDYQTKNQAAGIAVIGGLQDHQTWRTDGVSPTLTASMGAGGGHTPIIKGPTDRHGVAVGGIYTKSSEKFQCGILNGASRTIKASQHDAAVVLKSDNDFRIRKLTPKECWRLQGVPDEYFYKAAYGNEIPVDLVQKLDKRTMNREEYKQYSMLTRKRLTSDSQLYKQAGNACTVNVMYEIAKRMGYDYMGFEIDEGYYNTAQKRIVENNAQMRWVL